MSDKPETLAAALAELRARAQEERDCGWHGEADDLLALADRIEAAAERELSRAADDAASRATLDRTAKDAAEYVAYAMAYNSATQGPAPAAPADELLSAILAEMRLDADILVFPTLTPDKLRTYADRIEAAAERERNAHTNDIHNALYMADGIPGNAAAMRRALESVECNIAEDEPGRFWLQDPEAILHEVQAALAAPARNCDRFATVGAAHKAWRATDQERDFADWLFDKAEGGAE